MFIENEESGVSMEDIIDCTKAIQDTLEPFDDELEVRSSFGSLPIVSSERLDLTVTNSCFRRSNNPTPPARYINRFVSYKGDIRSLLNCRK